MNDIPNFWQQHSEEIQNKIGYEFKNKALLMQAFTHCSFSNETNFNATNERLEFLGDAVLDLIVTEYLYSFFPNLEEGDLTTIRSRVVDASACYSYANDLELQSHILLGKGEKKGNLSEKPGILANLFEALVGAIYIDGGLLISRQFLLNHINPSVTKATQEPSHNWKAKLQEFSQQYLKINPKYKVLHESGPDHKKTYTCGVFMDERNLGSGTGPSKKQAQQLAAKEAIRVLKQLIKDRKL